MSWGKKCQNEAGREQKRERYLSLRACIFNMGCVYMLLHHLTKIFSISQYLCWRYFPISVFISHVQVFTLVILFYHLAHLLGFYPQLAAPPHPRFFLGKVLQSNVCPLAHLKSLLLLCLTLIYSLCASHEMFLFQQFFWRKFKVSCKMFLFHLNRVMNLRKEEKSLKV